MTLPNTFVHNLQSSDLAEFHRSSGRIQVLSGISKMSGCKALCFSPRVE